MNGSMSEKELREFSQALGSLIPKKGENLDDEAFLYGLLILLSLLLLI